jgi:hypothetical protein
MDSNDAKNIADKFNIAQRLFFSDMCFKSENGLPISLPLNSVNRLILEKYVFSIEFNRIDGVLCKTSLIESFTESDSTNEFLVYPNPQFLKHYKDILKAQAAKKQKLSEIEEEEYLSEVVYVK